MPGVGCPGATLGMLCQIYVIALISPGTVLMISDYNLIYLYTHNKISITAILVLMLSKNINCCLVNFIAQDKGAWGEIID